MEYFVYILYSPKLGKYYVGSTDNLERRIEEHQWGKTKFSRTGAPWTLKYSETYNSRAEAMDREREIKKKKSRNYIAYLIQASLR